jgi:ribosomal-protein-alanine N-acetyltransferase
MDIPTIITPQLTLRSFIEQDAAPLHRIFGAPGVLRYFPSSQPPSLDQVRKMIAGQLKHWEKYGYGWWATVPRSENTFIGWSGLQFLPETDETEIAYLLDPDFWGRGLATEAAQAGLRYGFQDLGLQTIVAIVHPENAASRRVIDKLGMSFVEQKPYFGMDCCRYVTERAQA